MYVLNTRYEIDFVAPKFIQINIKVANAVNNVICHALVSIKKVVVVHSVQGEMVNITSWVANNLIVFSELN